MTLSSNEPTMPEREPQIAESPEENVGYILQRGGKRLTLQKMPNRFSVRVQPQGLAQDWRSRVPIQYYQPMPQTNLQEVVVKAEELDTVMETLRRSDSIAFASHVYKPIKDPAMLIYLTSQITIEYKESTDEATKKAIASNYGLRQLNSVETLANTFVYEVTDDATENPIKITNRLIKNPDILQAEPNIVVPTQKYYRPKDTLYDKQWYLNNSGGYNLAAGSDISAERAWDITRGDRSIVVAIADDSVDLDHPDFQGLGKIVAPFDLRDRDRLPMPEAPSDNHGTACAGIAVAEENGEGVVGVAPGCALMAIRTSGYLDDGSVEEIFDWAIDNGAAVISCSWGPSAIYFPLSLRQNAVITKAAKRGRHGKGCVVLFAAGNANRPVDGVVDEKGWPNNLIQGETPWLGGFTLHPDVITVAACTSLNKKSVYSNWGTGISVCAPSNNAPPGIWMPETGYISTPPEIQDSIVGLGIFTTDRIGAAGYERGDFTGFFGGTSSATPVVAGVVALMLSANPDLKSEEVREIIQETTDKIVDPDPDPQLGTMLGNYDANGHSQWFGFGKVNAYKAVLAARERRSPLQQPTKKIRAENNSNMAIPDFDLDGVTSVISISDSGLVRDIEVSVEIEHTYLGDVDVHLIAPNGQKVLLQGRTLGRDTALKTTYSLETTPQLRRFLNLSVAGNWQLLVIDRARFDKGTLKGWQLILGV
ncbi:MAG: S8 family serine peptidase [Cyanobacteriota bacterium]|nr:S8 family serine peptidase [Cyanobacteriota bacterium]